MENLNQLYQDLLSKELDSLEREWQKEVKTTITPLSARLPHSGLIVEKYLEVEMKYMRLFVNRAIAHFKRLSSSPALNTDELEKTYQHYVNGVLFKASQRMKEVRNRVNVPADSYEVDLNKVRSDAWREMEIVKAERQFVVEKAAILPLTTVRDSLTKLLTRGDFNAELPQTLAEAERANRPLSLIMVDIYHFKNVNDTYGHQKGDEVLAGVAACIASIVENKGRAYRYGGEEIVIVLNNHDIQEATAVAERARQQLESKRIADISVTASFGVSAFPDHGGSSVEIIKAADAALYDAKNRGRNLVRISGEPEPPKDQVREPERKLPSHGVLTEKEKRMLREQYFRGVTIRCPRDKAILKVNEITEIGKATASLLIWCKMCGLTEEL